LYKNKKISVVVPAYNEEKLIANAISVIPRFVDKIIVINDASKDKTLETIQQIMKFDQKIHLINHKKNQGVGGAIASGYKWSRENDIDIAAVMAGDAQMHPDDLPNLLDAIIEKGADFAKGNRLLTPGVQKNMPRFRLFASQVLSLLTKIASGYWHVIDPQCGFTAINKKGLDQINWDKSYKRYGQPNDLLVRLNVANMIVKDVNIKPIYKIGERSGINYGKLIFTLSWLLFKDFIWRLKEKYVILDFHPLVFFYFLGGVFTIATIVLLIRLLYFWYVFGQIPAINALALFFSFNSGAIFILFAMWFDMEYNKNLK